jgi:hypothetical protein
MRPLARHLVLSLCLAAAPLAGCQAYPGARAPLAAAGQVVAGSASLSVRPSLDGYRAQTVTSAYTRSHIIQLLLKLYVVSVVNGVEQETEALKAPGQPIELENVELDKAVSFTGLKPHTTYRVRAFAYKATGRATKDLISTGGADCAVTVSLTDDNRPAAATLRVRLRDRDASLKAVGANLVVDDGRSATRTAAQQHARVAYNGQTHESLVVWEDERGGFPRVYGRRISANGLPAGDDFALTTSTLRQFRPVVVYDGHNNGFLVVWGEADLNAGAALYGRRVSAAGVPDPAGPFVIASPDDSLANPAVAYNSQTGGCLVTWQSFDIDASKPLIRALLVGPTGTPNPAAFIAVGTGDKPAVAYNDRTNQWLVTCVVDGPSATEIHGRHVDASGRPDEAPAVLVTDAVGDWAPALAYSGHTGRYMLTWNRSNGQVYAQPLTGAGGADGSAIPIATSGYQPAVAASAEADEFLLTWQQNAPSRVFAQRVGSSGALAGSPFRVDAGGTNMAAATVYDSQADVYVVAWSSLRANAADIYYARVGASYTPADRAIGPAAGPARQLKPIVAYNPTRRTYLAMWEDDRGQAANYKLYGCLLNEDGTPAGEAFLVLDAGILPTLTYNARNDEFLVSWCLGSAFYTQRISATGALVGSPVTFSTGSPPSRTSVAYDSLANAYCVTWSDAHTGTSVAYGRRMNADGTPDGAAFALDASVGPQTQPSVAYSPKANGFLFTWSEGTSPKRVRARRMSGAGVLDPAGSFALSTRSNDQTHPVVAYSNGLDAFLVAWQDLRDGNYQLAAQRVGATGVPDASADLVLSGTVGYDEPHALICLQQTNEFLITWGDYRHNAGAADLYGQRIGGSGPADPAAQFVISGASGNQHHPALAYNGVTNTCLVLWQDARGGEINPDLYGQLLDSYALP